MRISGPNAACWLSNRQACVCVCVFTCTAIFMRTIKNFGVRTILEGNDVLVGPRCATELQRSFWGFRLCFAVQLSVSFREGFISILLWWIQARECFIWTKFPPKDRSYCVLSPKFIASAAAALLLQGCPCVSPLLGSRPLKGWRTSEPPPHGEWSSSDERVKNR